MSGVIRSASIAGGPVSMPPPAAPATSAQRSLLGWLALLGFGGAAAGGTTPDAHQGAGDGAACHPTPRGVAETLLWYHDAADHGDPAAMRSIGFMHETGLGVARDIGGAVGWYRQAAEAGDASAMAALGRCYETGQGVKADLTEACRWYRMAASCGDREARLALARLQPERALALARPIG